jgi:hypothetical protein
VSSKRVGQRKLVPLVVRSVVPCVRFLEVAAVRRELAAQASAVGDLRDATAMVLSA